MSESAEEEIERARRRGRAEGLRLAARLLREGDLVRDGARVLDRIAEEEDREQTGGEAQDE